MTAPAKTKQPGPPLWLSIAVFALGAILAAIGGTTLFNRVLEPQAVDSFVVPGAEERTLDPGEYDVFGLAGSFTDFSSDPTFDRQDVTITWLETGEDVPVDRQTIPLDLGRQTQRYERVGVFTVSDAGTYRVEVASIDDSRAVVARAFFASFEEIRVPLVLFGVGSVILLVGTLMIIFGIVRRSRATKRAAPQSTTPGIYQTPPPTSASPSGSTAPSAPPRTNPAPPLSPTPPPGGLEAPEPKPPPPEPPPSGASPASGETNTPW